MLDNLRKIFDKVVDSEGVKTPEAGVISFVNPSSALRLANCNSVDISKITVLYSDGFFLTWILKLLYGCNVVRRSFDSTSIGLDVLLDDKVAVIGATQSELENFSKLLLKNYGVSVLPLSNGFVDFNEENLHSLVEKMRMEGTSVLVLGLGCPKQEEIGLAFHRLNSELLIYTCGAFITQTARGGSFIYYPGWIDKTNLRWLYRLYKEPHTLKRLTSVFWISVYAVLIKIMYAR